MVSLGFVDERDPVIDFSHRRELRRNSIEYIAEYLEPMFTALMKVDGSPLIVARILFCVHGLDVLFLPPL